MKRSRKHIGSEFILNNNKKSKKQRINKKYVKVENQQTIDKYIKKQVGKGLRYKKINENTTPYQKNGIGKLADIMRGGDGEEGEKKGKEYYVFTKAQIIGFWMAYKTYQIPKKQYIAFKYMRKSAYYIDRLKREMAIWGKYAIKLIEDEGKKVGHIKKVHNNIDNLFKSYKNMYEKKGGSGLIRSQNKVEKYKRRFVKGVLYNGINLREKEVKNLKNKYIAL